LYNGGYWKTKIFYTVPFLKVVAKTGGGTEGEEALKKIEKEGQESSEFSQKGGGKSQEVLLRKEADNFITVEGGRKLLVHWVPKRGSWGLKGKRKRLKAHRRLLTKGGNSGEKKKK